MKPYSKYLTFLNLIIFLTTSMMNGQVLEIPRSSPSASISQTIGVCSVSIIYGRPSANGRKIIGGLVPFDKVWRAGANEATVIAFNYAIIIAGNKIPAGKYGLFMIPKKDKWIVILNSDWSQWGAYNYNKDNDVLRIEIIPQKVDYTEMCTYTFVKVTKSEGVLKMAWENLSIDLEISTDTHEQTIKEINKVSEDWYSFSAAAQYYFYQLNEKEKALQYIDIAIALNAPNPSPWMLKSQILASQGKYKQAVVFAEEAIEVSKKNNFLFEVEENEENINKWKKL
jgi:tetratricopeptide (TPR) repeat protein